MEESSLVSNKRIMSLDDEDRISALPDSILHHILSFLPSTREVLRTAVLSKRWQNQWAHVPVLVFDPRNGLIGSIENALMLHDCPKVKKFHLNYAFNLDPLFGSKIRFAIRKCVEELFLLCNHDESYLLPKSLVDNASLVRLKMANCHLKRGWAVNWPSLKSLEIDCRVSRLGYNRSQGIANVVSGSPMLESLEIRGTIRYHDTIVSKSLKKLSFVDAEIHTCIEISCPNLVELRVLTDLWRRSTLPVRMVENVLSRNPSIHSLELVNCTRFRNLDISSKTLKVLCLELCSEHGQSMRIKVSCPNLDKLDILCSGDKFHAVNLSSSTCATIDYVYPRNHNSVKRMLQRFEHANRTTIESSFFWIISNLDVEVFLYLPMLSSKCLNLNVGGNFCFALPGITYALRLPALEMLVIQLNSEFHERELEKDLQDLVVSILNYWYSNGSAGFTCLVSHLTTVKIIGLYEEDYRCKIALDFVKFVLKNARVLNKMIVVLEKPRTSFALEVSQKLSSYPRCSQGASIEVSCSS